MDMANTERSLLKPPKIYSPVRDFLPRFGPKIQPGDKELKPHPHHLKHHQKSHRENQFLSTPL